ncbi:MAG: hypothetical protein FJ288_01760 [Planctomycetes bacterium]|nr:hypothetical protein [Planctomycetota bacterium]
MTTMNLSWWRAAAALAAFLAGVPAARAQPFTPRIGYVYPAGGRQGAALQVTVGGQYLSGANNVYISGTGVKSSVVEYARPLTPGEANNLREELTELLKKPKDAETFKGIAEIRRKLATFNRNITPAIAEIVTVEVTVAPDAEPGRRELRLMTPAGLSNPRVFCVGQLPEFSEKATTSITPPADPRQAAFRREPAAAPPDPDMNVTLPTVLNGQIIPGDVDRYRFQAGKGQRLVVAAGARELIPYLPDAVPGWFQAAMTLYDAQGKEVAYNDDFRFHPDPVLCYEIPADGQYVLEIQDAIYRGREDFVYRIAVGELPLVTSIFPLGGRAGTQTAVEVKGWNLPVAGLTQDNKDRAPGTYAISVRKGDLVSNSEPFAVDTLPECLEKEPNNLPAGAQPVTLPLIVNGRIDQPGDWDVFRLEGRAGDEIVAEVHARRLDSPLDSVLKLSDAAGRQLAFNDDHEDKGSGLNTHHADSLLTAVLPAGGTCYLHLGDAQRKGGAEYAYRLRISPPRPDFQLRVVPSSINVRGIATVPLTVYALRKDGFADKIALALKDAPAGFTLDGAQVPAGQDQVRITLTVPPTPTKEPLSLAMEGRAFIQAQEVVRPAAPAEDMMQAFAYRHLVGAEELKVAVSGRYLSKSTVRILGPAPVCIPAGKTARIQVSVPPVTPFGRLEFELSEPPDGIAIQKAAPDGALTQIVLESDAAKVKPGLKGNLIVNAFALRSQAPPPGKTQANQRRMLVGTLPAMPFEIVAP